MTVITGTLADYPLPDSAPEFKGSIVIEWPVGSARPGITTLLPGPLTTVRDVRDGGVIPCGGMTLHVLASGVITADVAVFLDQQGEIIRDPDAIWRESDGVPATFPFLVEEMKIGRT